MRINFLTLSILFAFRSLYLVCNLALAFARATVGTDLLSSLENNQTGNQDEGMAHGSEHVFHHRLDAIEKSLSSLVGGLQILTPMLREHDRERYVPDVLGQISGCGEFDAEKLGRAARQIYRSRRKRDALMPAHLFGEPAWDLLLDLFASTCEGRKISITSACVASSVPSTTALRWISLLVDAGFVIRTVDHTDGRRTFVNLTPKGYTIMTEYLQNYLNI